MFQLPRRMKDGINLHTQVAEKYIWVIEHKSHRRDEKYIQHIFLYLQGASRLDQKAGHFPWSGARASLCTQLAQAYVNVKQGKTHPL